MFFFCYHLYVVSLVSLTYFVFINRFPTLNRWIQSQANIQLFSDAPRLRRSGFIDNNKKAGLKRRRHGETEIESEEDDAANSTHVTNSNPENLSNSMENSLSYDDVMMWRSSLKKDNLDLRNSASPFFEWENESIYEGTVQRWLFNFPMMMLISVFYIKRRNCA